MYLVLYVLDLEQHQPVPLWGSAKGPPAKRQQHETIQVASETAKNAVRNGTKNECPKRHKDRMSETAQKTNVRCKMRQP